MQRVFFFLKHSKFISLLLKIGLTLFAFWFVLRGLDVAEFKQMLQGQERDAFFEAILLLFAQIILGTFRWQLIVKALAGAGDRLLGWKSTLKLYYISVFFNCCLPGTVGGDVIRVWMARSEHMKLPLAISSVVIDRLIALLALGVLGLLTMPILAEHLGFSAWLITPPLLVIGFGGLYILFNLDRLLGRVRFIKIPHWLVHFVQSLRLLLANPGPAAWSLCYAVVAHISYCLCVYVLAKSFGSPIAVIDAITLVPWVLLVSIIPLSIGGWGLREAGMVYMLGLVAVPQAAALALSVQLGLLYIVISLPAGLLWLVQRKQKHDIAL